MFSKACEYGIKAVVYIASESLDDKRVKIGDIANYSGSPEAFTAKVLGKLTKAGIINSYKGPNGGFELDKTKMKDVKLSEIVFVIDGDEIYNGCALGLSECDECNPCPMHESFVNIREELKTMLKSTSIYDLATEYKAGNSTLIR